MRSTKRTLLQIRWRWKWDIRN